MKFKSPGSIKELMLRIEKIDYYWHNWAKDAQTVMKEKDKRIKDLRSEIKYLRWRLRRQNG